MELSQDNTLEIDVNEAQKLSDLCSAASTSGLRRAGVLRLFGRPTPVPYDWIRMTTCSATII